MTDPFEGAIEIEDIKDEDVGRELLLINHRTYNDYPITRNIQMIIRAPRGRLVIFEPTDKSTASRDRRGEAVRAFMEMHRNDP